MPGCKSYYREYNVDGIAEVHHRIGFSISKANYVSTYSADGVLLKRIELHKHQDTISKRCFTYKDIMSVKKQMESLSGVKYFQLECYSPKDITQCVGLFKLYYYEKPNTYSVPVVKLQDTILINSDCKNEMSESVMEYVKEQLSNYYDSTETACRISCFKQGKQEVFRICRRPILYINNKD